MAKFSVLSGYCCCCCCCSCATRCGTEFDRRSNLCAYAAFCGTDFDRRPKTEKKKKKSDQPQARVRPLTCYLGHGYVARAEKNNTGANENTPFPFSTPRLCASRHLVLVTKVCTTPDLQPVPCPSQLRGSVSGCCGGPCPALAHALHFVDGARYERQISEPILCHYHDVLKPDPPDLGPKP